MFLVVDSDRKSIFQDRLINEYRDGENHFNHVLQCLFIPSVKEAGYNPILPNAKGSDLIHAEIIKNLETADLVLCDISCLNPNVFFEFGIRTSLNKPVCIVKDELTTKVPFDTSILNYHEYKSALELWESAEEITKLSDHIKASAGRSKGENSLWKYFGLRAEAKPYEVVAGSDSKLEYLTMQIDSISQQIRDFNVRSSLPAEEWLSHTERIINFTRSLLPSNAEFSKFSKKGGTYYFYYEGNLPAESRSYLTEALKQEFGISVVWVSIGSKKMGLTQRDNDAQAVLFSEIEY